jgi:hypothetical protein
VVGRIDQAQTFLVSAAVSLLGSAALFLRRSSLHRPVVA